MRFLPSVPKLCKGSARRAKNKEKTLFSAFYSEPQPTLRAAKVCKASEEQRENFVFCFSSLRDAERENLQCFQKFLQALQIFPEALRKNKNCRTERMRQWSDIESGFGSSDWHLARGCGEPLAVGFVGEQRHKCLAHLSMVGVEPLAFVGGEPRKVHGS